MFPSETVLSGAPHPGTEIQVLRSAAGYYVGFLDEDGLPFSRETSYFPSYEAASAALEDLKTAIQTGPAALALLPFIRS